MLSLGEAYRLVKKEMKGFKASTCRHYKNRYVFVMIPRNPFYKYSAMDNGVAVDDTTGEISVFDYFNSPDDFLLTPKLDVSKLK